MFEFQDIPGHKKNSRTFQDIPGQWSPCNRLANRLTNKVKSRAAFAAKNNSLVCQNKKEESSTTTQCVMADSYTQYIQLVYINRIFNA